MRVAWLLGLGGSVALVSGCHSRPTGPVWDVPALVGQPIDAASQTLGPAQEGAATDPAQRQSTWTREGTTLSATWKPGNKRVTAWTLVSRDQDHAVREEDRALLLTPGRLQENDARYSLDWIEAPDRPLFYTGVRVVPAPKNHAVVLRLSGVPSLVQLTYSITGAQGKNETILVIAPWEEPFTLPDDSQISLKATVARTIAGNAPNMKIEIISDGQVVGSAASAGQTISCQTEL